MNRKSFLLSFGFIISLLFVAGSAQAAEYCTKTAVWGNAAFMDCYMLTPSGHYMKVGEGMAFGYDKKLSNGKTSRRITAYSYGGTVYAQGLNLWGQPISGCTAKATSNNPTVTDTSGCGGAIFVQLKILKRMP